MGKKLNLKNNKIGDLTVLDIAPSENKKTYWYCQCKCGRNVTVPTSKLRSNKKMNCGKCNTSKVRKPQTVFVK